MTRKRRPPPDPPLDWGGPAPRQEATRALVPATGSAAAPLAPVDTKALAASARETAKHVSPQNTKVAYASDWRLFERWTLANGKRALPADTGTVQAFLLDAADGLSLGKPRKSKTVARYLASISVRHREAKFPSPWEDEAIQKVLRGIQTKKAKEARVAGKKSEITKKAPLLVPLLHKAVEAISVKGARRLQGLRDRALLLVGFSGAFRRTELVGLDMVDLEWVPQGLQIHLGRTKTDQIGVGRDVGIEPARRNCPLQALRDWLSEARIENGPVFRATDGGGVVLPNRLSDDQVAEIIKTSVKRIGLDPTLYAGHSLRAGFITEADRAGKSVGQISQVTGHRDAQTVLGYMHSELFGPHSAGHGLLDKE